MDYKLYHETVPAKVGLDHLKRHTEDLRPYAEISAKVGEADPNAEDKLQILKEIFESLLYKDFDGLKKALFILYNVPSKKQDKITLSELFEMHQHVQSNGLIMGFLVTLL